MQKVIPTIQDSSIIQDSSTIQDYGIANFYDGIEAHTASLVEHDEGLYVTLILFYTDETNREYASYWFPEELKRRKDLNPIIEYLEKCRIYFGESDNKEFIVNNMKSLFESGNLRLNSGPLMELPLEEYFLPKDSKSLPKILSDAKFFQ